MGSPAEAELTSELVVVGFGGVGTLDLYTPYGEMGPVTEPGAKEIWTNWADELPDLLAREDVEKHVGGNVLNALTYLAGYYGDVRLASVIGEEGQIVSDSIRARLEECAVANHSVQVMGYNPSISKITREAPGSDRILYGRTRDPLVNHLTPEQVRTSAAEANVVIASSVNDAELVYRIFMNTPRSAFLAFSPGSAELRDAPGDLLETMAARKPDLLSLNDLELAKLLGMPPRTRPEILVEQASAYALNILCTLGVDGMILRTADGQITRMPAHRIPDEEVIDTLGTGDRATAAVTHGLLQGQDPLTILENAARSTAELTRYIGANGDIRPRVGTVALAGTVQ